MVRRKISGDMLVIMVMIRIIRIGFMMVRRRTFMNRLILIDIAVATMAMLWTC